MKTSLKCICRVVVVSGMPISAGFSFCTDDQPVQSACSDARMRQCGLTATPSAADCGQVMARLESLFEVGCPVTTTGPPPVIVAESGVR